MLGALAANPAARQYFFVWFTRDTGSQHSAGQSHPPPRPALLTFCITVTTWDNGAGRTAAAFPEVSPAKSELRFIKIVSNSTVKLCAPHCWLRLHAFHSNLWQPSW